MSRADPNYGAPKIAMMALKRYQKRLSQVHSKSRVGLEQFFWRGCDNVKFVYEIIVGFRVGSRPMDRLDV
jgi:hypothetical protein